MRAGQRAGKALDLVTDATGRILVTVQFAAAAEQRHLNVVRRCAAILGPAACDVRTGALLYDAGQLGKALNAVPRAPRGVRRKSTPGHAAKSSRSVS